MTQQLETRLSRVFRSQEVNSYPPLNLSLHESFDGSYGTNFR